MARYGRQGPVGMGGWLAVFVATLALNAMAIILFIAVGMTHILPRVLVPGQRRYFEFISGWEAAQGCGYGYLAWCLLARRNSRTPQVVAFGLWLLALLWPASLAVASMIEFGDGSISSVVDASTFRTIAYAGIWTAYLLRSDRVANTYAPRADALADVFG